MPTTFSPSTLLALIAATAATVWLISAYYLVNSPAIAARRSRAEPGKVDDQSGPIARPTTIVGALEVDVDFAGTSTRLATALARGGIGMGGPVEIAERTDGRVSFVVPGSPRNPRGEVQIAPAGRGRTRFEYAIEYGALRGFLVGGWIVQGCGLVTLAVLYWALGTYVATNPNPAIRWQSVQMIQCIHLIWPPFLLGYRYRAGYGLVRRQMDTAIKNLPHTNG